MSRYHRKILLASLIGLVLLVSSAAANNFFYYNGQPYPVQLSDSLVTVVLDQSAKDAKYIDADCIDTTFEPITVNSASTTYRIKEEYTINEALTQLRHVDNVEVANPVIGSPDSTPVYLTDEFIVRFHDGVTAAQIDNILWQHDLEVRWIDTSDVQRYYLRMKKTSAEDMLEITDILYETMKADYSTPNFYNHVVQDAAPNDPYYSEQWHLKNRNPMFPNADIHFEQALDFEIDSAADVVVAIVDAGFDISHEDFDSTKFLMLYDAAGFNADENLPDGDPRPGPEGGTGDKLVKSKERAAHGTNVLGIINATTNNGTGVAGIAPFCKFILIKAWDDLGTASTETVRRGIWAAAISGWAGNCDLLVAPWHLLVPDAEIEKRLEQAWKYNVTSLFAAGSDAGTVKSPAWLDCTIAVGATNKYDNRVFYSATGARLDIVAPGKEIWTLDRKDSSGAVPNPHECWDGLLNYHCEFGGTSASCAVAAGIAARVFAAVPEAQGQMWGVQGAFGRPFGFIRDVLCGSADDMVGSDNIPGRDTLYGSGRVNAYKAMLAIQNCNPNGDTSEVVDIDDIVYLIHYVFEGGPEPVPYLWEGDVNCDGDPPVDIDDIVYLINFVFGGGPSPQIPCFNRFDSCVKWPVE